MYYIKLFDRFHNILDEIHEFSNLTYTKTLNGVGKCTFKVPLGHPKTTPTNYTKTNHIEVYKNNSLVWGGYIVQLDFEYPSLSIGAYGYLDIFNHRRLREKSYSEMKYSKLFQTVFNELNGIYALGLTLGYLDDNCLRTQRTVNNEDMSLDKFLKWCEESNYYIEVSDNREFNFYTKKERKTHFELIYGTEEGDNIISTPSLSQSIIDMANNVYSETERQEEVEGENIDIRMTSMKEDSTSINKYGLFEGVYNANNSIVYQSTLDNYVNEELRKRAYPSNSISFEIANTKVCPIHDLEVGDILSLYLKQYFEFKEEVKLLEITIDTEKDTASVTVGETLFKPNKPVRIRYAK